MSQGDGRKLKLIVVDDERDNLDLLYRTFRRDFQVFRVDSAKNALQILDQEGEMAVIISDQRMPEMNGTEFLGKTVERFPDTIRILLTGYTDVEDLVEAINAGKVFKYIVKPWNPTDLMAVVKQAAETYQVIKQRTNELRRTLRRESLMNAVMSAIRESLDYRSMLQTIVETIGQTFDASYCLLRPIEGDRLAPESFCYQAADAEADPNAPSSEAIEASLQQILQSRETLITQESDDNLTLQLMVPLTYQQDFLAILYVYQYGNHSRLPPEDIRLLEGVAEQAALALSQAKLYQRSQEQALQLRAELEVARQIQTNLLRQSWPEIEGLNIQACCYPAREVGGDFFEVYVHPHGDIWLAVGDVSGKGVPAALFMASAISVLRRELSQEGSLEPNIVMQNLNSSLLEDLVSNNCFITMALARYTPSTGELVYANAGHIYPIVWSHRQVLSELSQPGNALTVEPNFLKTRGIPLGILPTWKGQAGRLTLSSGEVFLLTSDGITEAKSPSHQGNDSMQGSNSMLNQEGLWQLLTQQPQPLDLTELLDRVRADNTVQEDDQTLLSLEVL
ncbi:SpoIIE family protein phosphatase [Geitlerinema splendidum]|nr:SpoIIE family protein phosphatase [Geitlerinema splendidum]